MDSSKRRRKGLDANGKRWPMAFPFSAPYFLSSLSLPAFLPAVAQSSVLLPCPLSFSASTTHMIHTADMFGQNVFACQGTAFLVPRSWTHTQRDRYKNVAAGNEKASISKGEKRKHKLKHVCNRQRQNSRKGSKQHHDMKRVKKEDHHSFETFRKEFCSHVEFGESLALSYFLIPLLAVHRRSQE